MERNYQIECATEHRILHTMANNREQSTEQAQNVNTFMLMALNSYRCSGATGRYSIYRRLEEAYITTSCNTGRTETHYGRIEMKSILSNKNQSKPSRRTPLSWLCERFMYVTSKQSAVPSVRHDDNTETPMSCYEGC